MAVSQAVLAIAKGVALFNVVACLTTPVAHFAIVFPPGMHGSVADSDLSSASSLAFEVRGLVHVAVDVTADASNGISGGELFRAAIHC